jgi:hypothetical protein
VNAAARDLQTFTSIARRGQYPVQLAQAITHGAVVLEPIALLDARGRKTVRWLGKGRGDCWLTALEPAQYDTQQFSHLADRALITLANTRAVLTDDQRQIGITGHR